MNSRSCPTNQQGGVGPDLSFGWHVCIPKLLQNLTIRTSQNSSDDKANPSFYSDTISSNHNCQPCSLILTAVTNGMDVQPATATTFLIPLNNRSNFHSSRKQIGCNSYDYRYNDDLCQQNVSPKNLLYANAGLRCLAEWLSNSSNTAIMRDAYECTSFFLSRDPELDITCHIVDCQVLSSLCTTSTGGMASNQLNLAEESNDLDESTAVIDCSDGGIVIKSKYINLRCESSDDTTGIYCMSETAKTK